MTAPVLSVTVPNSVAVESCAHAAVAVIAITIARNSLNLFILIAPSRAFSLLKGHIVIRGPCHCSLLCGRPPGFSRDLLRLDTFARQETLPPKNQKCNSH